MDATTMLPWGSAGTDSERTTTEQAQARLPRPRNAQESSTSLTTVRVLVADPDPESRLALRSALVNSGVEQVEQVADEREVSRRIRENPGDLLLVSLAFGAATPTLVAEARAAGWTRVIALSPQAEIGAVIDAVGAGAHGVLLGRRSGPPPAHLPTTINDLSAREVEVLNLVADGRSNKWIGDQLSLSALTVKSHLARIGRKLGTGDRAHMVALALRAGVIS